MTELMRRTLTGSGLIIVILAALWFGPYSFTVLLLLIALLCLREFYRLLEVPGEVPDKVAGAILSVCLILSFQTVLSGLADWKWMMVNVPVAFTIFVRALYRKVKNPFQGLALTFLGVAAIALPLCFFVALPFLTPPAGRYRFELPLGCFMLLWANDTGAYLAGRKLGKHPLFRRVSPKKTWEGSFFGAAAALATSYALSRCIVVLNTLEWLVLALIIVVTGTYGDLFKSLLKRSRGVKDSGTILPGHGGMLDRFDSLLGSAPFICIYLILLRR